jgi:hypothetical protein
LRLLPALRRRGLFVAFVVFAAPLARAQQGEDQAREDSRAAFRRGVSAVKQQHWTEARDDFLQAYKLFPHPSILLDLGVSRFHVGEFVASEQDLTRFLAEDTGAQPEELQTARSTLADVRKHLGTLRVRISPVGSTATLDDKPLSLVAGELTDVRVSLGSHSLEASAPDHDRWSGKVNVDGPEAKVVDLTLSPRGEQHAGGGVPAQRIGSFVLFGTGVALAGFGIFAGVRSIDLANQYNTPTEANFQNPATKSEGIAFRTAADVTLVIAGACVVAGIILYVTTPPKKTQVVAVYPAGLRVTF